MKISFAVAGLIAVSFFSSRLSAQTSVKSSSSGNHMYIDVHQLEPGKVKFSDVAAAHKKDLATQGKYGVKFLSFWVDEDKGLVYCLSSAPDTAAIRKTHAEAHGLLPAYISEVQQGK